MKLFLASTFHPWPYSYMSTFSFSQGKKVIYFLRDRVLSFSRDDDFAFFPSYNRRTKHTKIIKTKYCSLPHPLSPRGVKTVTHHRGRKVAPKLAFPGLWRGMRLVSGRYSNSQVSTAGIRAFGSRRLKWPSHSGTSPPATINPSRNACGCQNWESRSGGLCAPWHPVGRR